MKKKILTLTALIFVFLILLLLIGCGGGDKKNDANTNGNKLNSYTYDVKYSDNTKIVSAKTVKKLISADKKSGIYKFITDADEIESLKPDEVVIFADHSLRKIKSVERSGDEIIVNAGRIKSKDSILSIIFSVYNREEIPVC